MLSLQMAAIVNALDNYTKIQYGENGHIEYGWSNNIREKITQFSFQLTRTNNDWQLNNLKNILTELLTTLKQNLFSSNTRMREEARGLLSVLYRMIGHTRDIIDGKGECLLTYMMILTWYDFFPKLARFAIRCLVEVNHEDNITIHQYGSWKDIKYFCEYCKNQTSVQEHPLIQYSVDLTNKQLAHDFLEYKSGTIDISLVAKWVPREKSSFGWLYEQLATHFFSAYLKTATTSNVKAKAVLKCKTDYRKILSTLNRHLDTLQIKQCDQVWSEIDFKKVTSISLSKQKKAFLNIKKDGQVRHPDNFDRIECAEHFNAHIQKAVRGETEMKGKRVGMADFTEQALELIRTRNQPEIDLLNSQWRDNSTQTGALGKFIAMVDVSGSMSGDPMNVAIALGIRIAEKSLLGKRVMTFSSKPTWVNLEKYDDFVSQVGIVSRAEWGMNTNFYAALDTILDAIIETKTAPEDVQDMVLVILSDMQMDSADRTTKQVSLYETMEKKYADAGIRVHGQPYKPPHILFWNLRSTSGFPTLSNQSNASMMSGFSPALLNLFCEQGLEALQSCSPWSLLERSLANPRYKIMGDKIKQEFDV
jgi:hypothetical protein